MSEEVTDKLDWSCATEAIVIWGLPDALRRLLGCTNAIDPNGPAASGVPQRQTLARMALRWIGTAMMEAE